MADIVISYGMTFLSDFSFRLYKLKKNPFAVPFKQSRIGAYSKIPRNMRDAIGQIEVFTRLLHEPALVEYKQAL